MSYNISSVFSKILETTVVHLTAGATARAIEEGAARAKTEYDKWSARRKTQAAPVIEIEAKNPMEEAKKINRGL